jgi:hypothetical protein
MGKLKLPFLQEELKRIGDWIKLADQKAAFLAIYYSAIAGLLISNKALIGQRILLVKGLSLSITYILLGLIATVFILGSLFLVLSIFPRLSNRLTNESLFYFGSISGMKYADFKVKIDKLTEISARQQLLEQIFTSSLIADAKMNNIKVSTVFLIVFAITSMTLLILI